MRDCIHVDLIDRGQGDIFAFVKIVKNMQTVVRLGF
jgi:hypothetical protein